MNFKTCLVRTENFEKYMTHLVVRLSNSGLQLFLSNLIFINKKRSYQDVRLRLSQKSLRP